MPLKLMYITNNPDVASIAQKYGVDRIWVDMEYRGKDLRQKGLDSVKNHHTVQDVKNLRPVLKQSELLVRINPWEDGYSQQEINDVIEAGADMIMLPMWKSFHEVRSFLDAVDGRVKTTLLLETKEAVECLDEVLANGGFDEIHVGLNDLHLSYHLTFMFQLLTNGVVEELCRKFEKAGVPYGFGGIARIGEGAVPAEKIIVEHYRLGSTRAILSRAFCDCSKITDIREIEETFKVNMKKLRSFEDSIAKMSDEDFERNQSNLKQAVQSVVDKILSR